ncbi:hypothetical protein [Streptosporangium sandarakinum]|uniref:hypothetical protein n=1 Tax=Streptosporangium sandarakinum TaxID=1260955 RepID=UPI00342AD71F
MRGEEWRRQPHRLTDLLWARVTDLCPLPGGRRSHPIAVCCEFPAGDSLVTTVLSDALVVMEPRRSPRGIHRRHC